MELELESTELRFRESLEAAFGTFDWRQLVIVRLRAGDGLVGVGEAAPLEPYDGVSASAVYDALDDCRTVLEAAEASPREEILHACLARTGIPQAVAAIDIALWDLEAKRAGAPVATLLSDAPASEIPVNATIAASEAEHAARQATAAVASGFRCLKVKVGVGDDTARVAAIRAAVGAEVLIRIDANGAWNVPQALDALEDLAEFGIEFCEEPVHGVESLRALRARAPVPIAMDETGAEPAARASGASDLVCLKISACGGISGLIDAAAAARAAGSEVYVASTFDGPIGIAAGLHAAAALGPLPPCGLATLSLFGELDDPFPARSGAIRVPGGGGLGAG